MTRINVAVKPIELTDKHLIAEHREMKRIPNVIIKGKFNMLGMPDKFTLGPGHVKFFYNKIKYLHDRYKAIYEECLRRGFNVTNYNEPFELVAINKPILYGDYIETVEDRNIILQRINERLNKTI